MSLYLGNVSAVSHAASHMDRGDRLSNRQLRRRGKSEAGGIGQDIASHRRDRREFRSSVMREQPPLTSPDASLYR
jgi:hypothetical protein